MLKIEYQGQFKRDYKLALKRGCNPTYRGYIYAGQRTRTARKIQGP